MEIALREPRDDAERLVLAYVEAPFDPRSELEREKLRLAVRAEHEVAWLRGLVHLDVAQRGRVVFALAMRRILRELGDHPPRTYPQPARLLEHLAALWQEGRHLDQLARDAFRAVRVFAAVNQYAGVSAAAAEVRRDAWEAAIGRPDQSSRMDAIRARLPVHVTGETGTGKELIGEIIMAAATIDAETWTARPAEGVNLSGVPREMVYADLFGVIAGAATDVREREGLLRRTHGGVAFLDEIAELEPHTQAMMLRAVSTGRIVPLGGREVDARPRLVTATHRDLAAECRRGSFRWDLYNRLAGQTISLPPLRERRDDIPDIIASTVARLRAEGALDARHGEACRRAAEAFVETRAARYGWPHNVRELVHIVYACALGQRPELKQAPRADASAASRDAADAFAKLAAASWTLDEALAWYVGHAVEVHGQIREAARQLGRSRNTIAAYLQGRPR